MADANTAALAYIEEVTWGTTPASALQTLRFTGENLVDQEESTESAEILSDRMLRAVRRTGRFCQGDINFELSDDVLDDLLEGVLADDWTSNVLENGTTEKSYTFEKQITVDGSPSPVYRTFKGCRLDTLSLTMQPGALITGTLGVLGKGGLAGTVTAGSGAYTAASSTEPLSCIDITTITEASVDPGDVTEITLNITNNLRRQMALGSSDPIGLGYGAFRVDGTMRLYFADNSLYTKFVNETETELEFTVTDSASSTLTFTIPTARWGPPEEPITGINTDIIASFPFTAVRDSVTGTMISVTRSA